MFSNDDIRARGLHILPLGFVLAGATSFAIWGLDLLPAISHAENTGFRGTVFIAWILLLGLGSFLLMGIAVIASAIRMITARSSRATTLAMIVFAALGLALIGWVLVDAIPKVIAQNHSQR